MFSRLARPVINTTRTFYGRDQSFNLLVDKRKYMGFLVFTVNCLPNLKVISIKYLSTFRYAWTWFVDLILVRLLYPNRLYWIQLLVLQKITKMGWCWCMEHPRKKAIRINVLNPQWELTSTNSLLFIQIKICPSIRNTGWFFFSFRWTWTFRIRNHCRHYRQRVWKVQLTIWTRIYLEV